jgi:hypothetical protein
MNLPTVTITLPVAQDCLVAFDVLIRFGVAKGVDTGTELAATAAALRTAIGKATVSK